MKRLLSATAALILTIVILSGCGNPPELQKELSLAFTAQKEDAVYKGAVTKDSDSLTIDLSEPYTVSGMSLQYEDSALSIRYAGHSANAASDYLPPDCMAGALYNALLYLDQAVYTDSKDGTDAFTIPTPYGDAALKAEDGVPISLTLPNDSWEFSFEPAVQKSE